MHAYFLKFFEDGIKELAKAGYCFYCARHVRAIVDCRLVRFTTGAEGIICADCHERARVFSEKHDVDVLPEWRFRFGGRKDRG